MYKRQVLSQPELAAKIRTIGPIVNGAGSPGDMDGMLARERQHWAKLTRDAGIQPE
mgnify:FL=1